MVSGIKLIKQTLLYHGLWEAESKRPRFRLLSYLYSRVGLVCIIYRLFVVHLTDVYMNSEDAIAMSESGVIAFLCTMAIVKTATLLFKTKETKMLLNNLKKIDEQNRFEDAVVQSMRAKTASFTDKALVRYISMTVVLALVSAFAQMPDAIQNRRLQDRGWHPYDIVPSPNYELTLTFYSMTIVWVINMVSVCDATIALLLVNIVRQFKILHYKITTSKQRAIHNLVRENQLKMEKEENHKGSVGSESDVSSVKFVSELEPWSEIRRKQMDKLVQRSNKLNIRSVTNKEFAGKENEKKTLIVKKRSKRIRNLNNIKKSYSQKSKYGTSKFVPSAVDIDNEMQRICKVCVNQHTALTRLVSLFESIFNPTFIVQFVGNLGITGVIALYLTLTPDKLSNKSQAFIQLLIGCLGELFVFCWMSSRLAEESTNLMDAVYNGDWLKSSEKFKKHMRIIISRANDPLIIKTAGFVPLSMLRYLKANNTAYNNYLAMMVVTTKQAYSTHSTAMNVNSLSFSTN